jgi:hypothetical protein
VAGLVELSIAGLPLEDTDLAALLRAFTRLNVLDVSGCQKLSPGAADILVHGSRLSTADKRTSAAKAQLAAEKASSRGEFRHGSVGSPQQQQQQQQPRQQQPLLPLPAGMLQVVDMQRCFQLEAPALTSMLAALRTCSLSAVLCSHLTMDNWPPGSALCSCTATEGAAGAHCPAPADQHALLDAPQAAARHQRDTAQPQQLAPMRAQHAGLRVLALHNCVMLTPAGLRVISLPDHMQGGMCLP